jgi:hypothetical protein
MMVWFPQIDTAVAAGPVGSPRVYVVFCVWQCDKESRLAWRPAGDRALPKFSICWPGLHPPAKSVSNENKNTAFCCWPLPTQNIGRFRPGFHQLDAHSAFRNAHQLPTPGNQGRLASDSGSGITSATDRPAMSSRYFPRSFAINAGCGERYDRRFIGATPVI